MKIVAILLPLMCVSSVAAADVSSSSEPDTGIPIEKIITSVANQTHRKFVIDPRVQARVHLVGEDPTQVTYNELLTILELHGYVTFESSGYVMVLPDANARQVPQQMLAKGQTYPDAQVVNYTIPVVNGPAGFLVPILRPLLPQYAQLAAAGCSNTLLITDRYANVKRIEAIVKALDVGTPYKPEKCEMANPGEHRDQPAKRSDS
ncbi:MAG: hypothetical protein JSR66_20640 [Proteobacteria bacterium]|nr:hypothetical protein [Pseudomonadota bacterium]